MRNGTEICVLHVDDEPGLVELAADMLEREDDRLTVETATSATEGLEKLAEDHFGCVISDYDMPGQNGIEFLRTVRETYPNLPFILYTGKGSEEVASEAISAGVSDYLQKGTGTEQYELLANRIRSHVERTRAQRALEEQQSHFRQAQTVAQLGSWQLDLSTDELYWSDEVYELFGVASNDSLSYEEFLDYVHPDDRTEVDEAWTAALEGAEYDIEHRIVTTADETRWVRERADIEFDEDGTPIQAIGVVQDITERKERERARREDQAFIEQAMDAIDDIFFVVAPDGSLDRVNERACEVTGYTEKELLSMDAIEFFTAEEKDRVAAEIKEAFDTGHATLEANITTRDETQIPYEFRARRLTNTDDVVTSVVGIGRDISERKQRERRL